MGHRTVSFFVLPGHRLSLITFTRLRGTQTSSASFIICISIPRDATTSRGSRICQYLPDRSVILRYPRGSTRSPTFILAPRHDAVIGFSRDRPTRGATVVVLEKDEVEQASRLLRWCTLLTRLRVEIVLCHLSAWETAVEVNHYVTAERRIANTKEASIETR